MSAAALAFYVVLSFPPLLLAILGTVGLAAELVGASWQTEGAALLLDGARLILDADAVDRLIAPAVSSLLDGQHGGVLSIGFLAAVWSASRALRVALHGVWVAYGQREARSGLIQRLYGLVGTSLLVALSPLIVPLLLLGPAAGDALESWVPLLVGIGDAWRISYWPVVAILVVATVAIIYHAGTPRWTPWRHDIPGAVFATCATLLGTAALRAYVTSSVSNLDVYATLAAPLVALLWLYLVSFSVLLGAQINAELARGRARRHDPVG